MHRTIETEVRLADAASGVCDYIASDESLDSSREIVKVDGWDFSRMAKNAPFLNSHQYRGIDNCLGKVLNARVENGQLVETVKWAIDVPENKLAQLGWQMTQAGYLKAVSVGFLPQSIVTRLPVQNWPEEWQKASIMSAGTREGRNAWQAQQEGMQRDLSQVTTIYLQQQQTELSACVVGSNPNAVAKSIAEFAHAYKAGVLRDSDLELLSNEFASRCESGSLAGRPADVVTGRQRSRKQFLAAIERALAPQSRAYSFPSELAKVKRAAPFQEVTQTAQNPEQTRTDRLMKSNFTNRFDELTGSTKTAFERAEMARRGGNESEVERAVRLAFQAERRERRHCCGDPVERVLADPEQRLLFNAIGRFIMGARLNPDEDRVLGELKAVAKDFTPGISTASGPGQMLFPIPVNPEVWSALLTYGAFHDLGVRTISSAYERFAVVTAPASAIFINPSNQGAVTIPADTSFAGLSIFAPSNTVATRLIASYDVIQDMKADVANAVLSYLLMGLAARLDFACFSGNGANDNLSAGQFGIFYTAGIGSFVPANGVTKISGLSRSDFINTIGAVAPAALQRAENCRWYISPVLLPALMLLTDGQAPNYLLKTPAETQGEWHLAGFPVTWAAQAPSVNAANAPVAAFGESQSYLVALREVYELQRGDWIDAQVSYQYRALMRGYCEMRAPTFFATLQLAAA